MATSVTDPPRVSVEDVPPRPRRHAGVVLPLVVKIICLGIIFGVAIALTPTLIGQGRWLFFVIVWGIVALLLATYLTGRALPLKYLLPGTILLVLFVVFPIILTAQLSTTNLGDGTRSSKDVAIARIIGGSVRPNDDSPLYNLTVARRSGDLVIFLVDPETETVRLGTSDGLEDAGNVRVENGFVTEASGFTILTAREINASGEELDALAVPDGDATVYTVGVRHAFRGTPTLTYDPARETITDTREDVVYTLTRQGDRDFFVSADGERVSDQSWQASVGLDNYRRIFTDERIRADFISIFWWTLIFATLSVVTTFLLGLGLAVTMNDPRVRGQKAYRALIILPYAIPGFISLLIWSSFFNTDFGLINNITGLSVNWFGEVWTARFAVLLTNLWMGFPYMFLVTTGALQAIPGDLKEAASIDGASGFYGFRKITFPLLLVAVAPLLVATFAFNFNNYNVIALLTEGGPFDPANPTAGGTDILISYTIRLAFGAGGAQIGFASAISVVLFVITGVIAAIQFRATRRLEEVN